LGKYLVNFTTADENSEVSGGINAEDSTVFGVEEYKRPEYEVTVEAPQGARMGAMISAKVHAKYYFGDAVPNARVHYKVYQKQWTPVPPTQASWPVGGSTDDYMSTVHESLSARLYEGDNVALGVLVTEGSVTTDANGNAEVPFTIARWKAHNPDEEWVSGANAWLFTVTAEVTDASRRTVTGQAVVKTSAQPYYAWVTSHSGYYLPGENASFSLVAEDVNTEPVSARGALAVYRMEPRK
jgi:uncharacterized protein YfaS (alpha-2-macroglobulin family)